MGSLEHLDLLIGETLELLVGIAKEIKCIDGLDQKEFLMGFGRVMSLIWHERDKLYRKYPELKRDFVVEQEENPARYEELEEIHDEAYHLEQKNSLDLARQKYEQLYAKSKYGYFQLVSGAALYRIDQKNKRQL